MKGKISVILGVLVIFILCFTFSSFAAEVEDAERVELIRASRELVTEQSRVYYNKIGLFATNFGSVEGEVNLGGRLELPLPDAEKIVFVTEGIYLENQKDFSGFVSLKIDPLPASVIAPYFGGGAEVTAQANYQVFAGLDIWDNFFMEGKYINEEGEFTDSNFYLATGFQLNF